MFIRWGGRVHTYINTELEDLHCGLVAVCSMYGTHTIMMCRFHSRHRLLWARHRMIPTWEHYVGGKWESEIQLESRCLLEMDEGIYGAQLISGEVQGMPSVFCGIYRVPVSYIHEGPVGMACQLKVVAIVTFMQCGSNLPHRWSIVSAFFRESSIPTFWQAYMYMQSGHRYMGSGIMICAHLPGQETHTPL